MIRLSKPSKMPCKSWSLEALDTCPASTDSNGDLVPACVGCYATDGNYRFPNVKAPRVSNKQDWKTRRVGAGYGRRTRHGAILSVVR